MGNQIAALRTSNKGSNGGEVGVKLRILPFLFLLSWWRATCGCKSSISSWTFVSVFIITGIFLPLLSLVLFVGSCGASSKWCRISLHLRDISYRKNIGKNCGVRSIRTPGSNPKSLGSWLNDSELIWLMDRTSKTLRSECTRIWLSPVFNFLWVCVRGWRGGRVEE